MKIEKLGAEFRPIQITLETEADVEHMRSLLRHVYFGTYSGPAVRMRNSIREQVGL